VDLAWRRHDDDFILFRDHPERYRNTHATDVLLGKLSTFLAKGRRASLAALGEVSGEWIRSSRLGDHARQRTALAVDSHWGPSPRFSVQAGMRWDWYSPYGCAWSPGAGVAFFASPRLKLRASAGKAFRVPSFTELYYWSPTLRGNPALRPESAWNVDGGLDWYASETCTLSATVFRRWERDLIDYVRASDTDPWVASNIRRAVVDGVSLQLNVRPAAWVRALAGYAWTDFDLAPSPLQARYAADFARHVLTAGADFFPERSLRPGVTVRYKHRALTGAGYVVLSAALAYTRGPWELEFRVDNATDAVYEELSGVAMPGRGFFATLRYRSR
jgi:iron complex outermembrane receptor protein